MPSKEEAEAMADAILAAARKSSGRSPRARDTTAASTRIDSDSTGVRTPWAATVITGILTGGIVASLPSHRLVLGALVGLVIAAAVAVIANRLGR